MATGADNEYRTKVCICGEELVLKGADPPEYLKRVACVVNDHMEKLLGLHPTLVRHRLALLTAIYLADELEKLKQENAELLEALNEAR